MIEYDFENDLNRLYYTSDFFISEPDSIESSRIRNNLRTYIFGLQHWRETALQLSRLHGEAEADAERLAVEYEAILHEIGGVYWEEPGEKSPALIAHKNRKGTK